MKCFCSKMKTLLAIRFEIISVKETCSNIHWQHSWPSIFILQVKTIKSIDPKACVVVFGAHYEDLSGTCTKRRVASRLRKIRSALKKRPC